MALDANRPDLCIGIVGTGVMGQGIAQIAAAAGASVTLFDTRPEAAEAARRGVVQMFGKLAEKGKLTAEAAAAAGGRLRAADSLTDMAAAHVVVEAIVENLDAKRALFAELEGIVGDDCVLATNTSSLSVTAIAAGARRPGRIAGLHFFNPVPLMRVVEVIPGLLTEPEVTGALVTLARRMGHHPARAKDTPGFLVNHAGRGYGTEALRILGEGIADEATVDRVMREAAGFRMGPLELFDLTGLDVSHPVMESIYHQFYEEPRFRPSRSPRSALPPACWGARAGVASTAMTAPRHRRRRHRPGRSPDPGLDRRPGRGPRRDREAGRPGRLPVGRQTPGRARTACASSRRSARTPPPPPSRWGSTPPARWRSIGSSVSPSTAR